MDFVHKSTQKYTKVHKSVVRLRVGINMILFYSTFKGQGDAACRRFTCKIDSRDVCYSTGRLKFGTLCIKQHFMSGIGGEEECKRSLVASYKEEGVLVDKKDERSDSQKLSDLLENGIGSAFDLKEWALRARGCGKAKSTRARLGLLLEPCRADVAKLIAMQALESDTTRSFLGEQCVYAEITPESMDEIFYTKINFQSLPALTFYDLGSGTGKNVLLAAVTGKFHRCVGIEILPELSAISEALQGSFEEDVMPQTDDAKDTVEVEFRATSFLKDLEWVSEAGIVYCNTIMFEEHLMSSLASCARGMQQGALFITLGQDLLGFNDLNTTESHFEIVDTFSTNHSFGGGVDTFIHRRTSFPASSEGISH